MKLQSYKRTRGQTLVEYALIAAVIIPVLILASNGIQLMMKNQVDSTAKGLSSGKYKP